MCRSREKRPRKRLRGASVLEYSGHGTALCQTIEQSRAKTNEEGTSGMECNDKAYVYARKRQMV